MTSSTEYIIFIILLCIPASLYLVASFYNTIHPAPNMLMAIFIAVFFATFEYAFKIPIITYAHNNGISKVMIQFWWIIITLFGAWGLSYIKHTRI
jgi:hypothetical protein